MSAIIRRERFAGVTEGYALPSGDFVVAQLGPVVWIGSADLVHVDAPLNITAVSAPEPVRYPVLAVGTDRGRRVAGQGQSDTSRATWEWIEADQQWYDRGPNGGERPCLYLADGTLIIEPGGPNHPTEGWAGVGLDGRPVRIVRYDHDIDIHELTQIGPFTVGQSSFDPPLDGLDLLFDGKRYRVENGNVHTIWFVLGADGVMAITTRKLDPQNETVFVWLDANRITELPLAPTNPADPGGPTHPTDPGGPTVPTVEAPNRLDVVQSVVRDHPEIDTKSDNDNVRGVAVDYTARRLNNGGTRPWGRKARQSDGGNKNGDGLTYLRGDGLFEIIDILDGTNGAAAWGHKGIFRPGENGYWSEPGPGEGAVPVDPGGPDPGHPDPALADRVAALESKATALDAKYAAVLLELAEAGRINGQQEARIQALEQRPGSDLSGYAKKGDSVTVKATFDLGFIRRDVVGHGTIDR